MTTEKNQPNIKLQNIIQGSEETVCAAIYCIYRKRTWDLICQLLDLYLQHNQNSKQSRRSRVKKLSTRATLVRAIATRKSERIRYFERGHNPSALSNLINLNLVKLLKNVFYNFTCLPGYSKQRSSSLCSIFKYWNSKTTANYRCP